MPQTYRMTRAAYLPSLGDFRLFIREHCSSMAGMTADLLYDIQLAVDEACTNIITHGYADMDPGSIILDLEVETGKITVAVTDFGHAFEPDSTPAPDVNAPMEQREEGGFGLFFIRQSMDSMEYSVTEDGNMMVLTKQVPLPIGGSS